MFKATIISIIISFSINYIFPVHAEPFEYRYSKHWKYVYHKHNELSYQHVYCALYRGTEEYELPDKTKVNCLTENYAIEFDFASESRCGVSVSCCVSNTSRTRNTTIAT